MTTIYKETKGAGKRAIGYLPLTKNGAFSQLSVTINRMIDHAGWDCSVKEGAIIIKFPDKTTAAYSLEENNDYICEQTDDQ